MEITRVVVYWAECGNDKGWCWAVHYEEGSPDTGTIPGGEAMDEDTAIQWAGEQFGKAAEVGSPDYA